MAWNMLAPLATKAITPGGVDADYGGNECHPKTADERTFHENLHRVVNMNVLLECNGKYNNSAKLQELQKFTRHDVENVSPWK